MDPKILETGQRMVFLNLHMENVRLYFRFQICIQVQVIADNCQLMFINIQSRMEDVIEFSLVPMLMEVLVKLVSELRHLGFLLNLRRLTKAYITQAKTSMTPSINEEYCGAGLWYRQKAHKASHE